MISLISILICLVVAVWAAADKVRLSDIDVLTLVRGKKTTARRGSAVPQLKCVSGVCDADVQPASVQCRNVGSDGNDVNWRCDADLDGKFKFGRLEVSCEGFAYPDDPYVLVGSCGLEYELLSRSNSASSSSSSSSSRRDDESSDSGFGLGSLLVLATIVFCIYRCCFARAPAAPLVPQYGVRSPDDPPPYAYATAAPPAASSLPSAMSLAGAGAAGFALGRATAPTTHTHTTTTIVSSTPSAASASGAVEQRPATGFATTKRR